MPFKCQSCEREFEKKMRRPMDCPNPSECDLVEMRSSATQVSASALDLQADAIRAAREALMRDSSEIANKAEPLAHAWLLTDAGRFKIESGMVIGRGAMFARELFAEDLSISRRHVSFTLRDGCWYLQNLSLSGSPVLISHRLVGKQEEYAFVSGIHLLELGDTFTAEILIE